MTNKEKVINDLAMTLNSVLMILWLRWFLLTWCVRLSNCWKSHLHQKKSITPLWNTGSTISGSNWATELIIHSVTLLIY